MLEFVSNALKKFAVLFVLSVFSVSAQPRFGGSMSGSISTNVNAIQLPIEIWGTNGISSASVTKTFFISNPPSSTTLQLVVFGIEYLTQASVQVNAGSVIALNNTNFTCPATLQAAYGCLTGSQHTLTITTALASNLVTKGSNSITFIFNGTDGNSSGWRVLAFQIIGGGLPLISSNQFTAVDPNTWTPPLNNGTDIAAGLTLWQSATLTIPGPVPAAATLTTHCMDCHARTGRDLTYFNVSNEAITARSKFHGLNNTQGQQIASYIRSLSVNNGGTVPACKKARIWNPPYQPGPGIDSSGVSCWAAGAGIEAVLGLDSDMLPSTLPTSTPDDFDPTKYYNVRETRVAFEFLDWLQWLPTIHPADTYGSAFTSDATNTDYDTIRTMLAPGTLQSYKDTITNGPDWVTHRHTFETPLTPASNSPLWNAPLTGMQLYSLSQWQLVKSWEIMQDFGLEGMSQAAYGPTAEKWAWFLITPFQAAPNINIIPNPASGIGNGSSTAFGVISQYWYYVQLVLMTGFPAQVGCNTPLDFGYMLGFTQVFAPIVSQPQDFLTMSVLKKGIQFFTNGIGVQQGCGGSGFLTNDSNPVYVIEQKSTFVWTGVSSGTRAAILDNYFQAWLAVLKRFSPGNYYAGVPDSNNPVVTPGNPFGSANLATQIAFIIPHGKFWGVSSQTAAAFEAWAVQMWPLATNVNTGMLYDWPGTLTATCSTTAGLVGCSTDH